VQLRDYGLHFRDILIVGRALLQARIPVHRLVAAALVSGLREGHRRRVGRSDAGIRHADGLRE